MATTTVRRSLTTFDAGGLFSAPGFETRVERSSAASAMVPAVAYCQGTVFRHEIEAPRAGSLGDVTRFVSERFSRRFGTGPVDGKIQATIVSIVACGTWPRGCSGGSW